MGVEHMKSVGDAVADALVGKLSNDITHRSGGVSSVVDALEPTFRRRCRELGVEGEAYEIALRKAIDQVWLARGATESPIELRAAAGLIFAPYRGFMSAPPLVTTKSDLARPKADIIIVPQFAFVRYRADFAVIGYDGDASLTVIVECDGKDFHTSPAQAEKDRERSAYFNSWDMLVVRASGSEIFKNPASLGERVSLILSTWRTSRCA